MNDKPGRPRITFIEVLVIVAIGAIFYGMLWPGHCMQANEKVRRATCLSNLKQIGLALRLYAEEHGGELPCDLSTTTLGSFAMLTNNYQTSYKTWICPSDPNVSAGSRNTSFTAHNLSYAYGGFGLIGKAHPETPIACDRSSAGDPIGSRPWDGNSCTHKSDGGNVLYADGHVAFTKTMKPPMVRGKNP
jgi:prepilin-type processing-associated H-X9-DG protein